MICLLVLYIVTGSNQTGHDNKAVGAVNCKLVVFHNELHMSSCIVAEDNVHVVAEEIDHEFSKMPAPSYQQSIDLGKVTEEDIATHTNCKQLNLSNFSEFCIQSNLLLWTL